MKAFPYNRLFELIQNVKINQFTTGWIAKIEAVTRLDRLNIEWMKFTIRLYRNLPFDFYDNVIILLSIFFYIISIIYCIKFLI